MTRRGYGVGDRVRVTIDGEVTGVTADGTLTIQYRSDLGACETDVELDGTDVRVEVTSACIAPDYPAVPAEPPAGTDRHT